jgi:N-succinyldiaminopimelate aminotransferase
MATYFVMTDIRAFGEESGVEFCRRLPDRCGVVAVPASPFYDDPATGRTLVRFAFCKQPDVIDEAVRRLRGLARP